MGQEDGPVARICREGLADDGRIGCLAPFDVDLRHIGAVDGRDLREPVTERPDRHAEDPIAGGQRVDDRRLETAGTGAGQHRDVARGSEERLHAAENPFEHRRELRPAVVDHLAAAGLAHGRRQGSRAGDAQVGLESVHGNGLLESGGHDG